MMISYRFITTNDPEYVREKDLRNRVLRLPLGLVLSDDDVRGEEDQVHVIAQDGEGNVVGCVLVALKGASGRVRQMAVEASFQRDGIGSELLRLAEKAAADAGVHSLTLHARAAARRFYELRGYRAVSGTFIEQTIPHVAMMKEPAP